MSNGNLDIWQWPRNEAGKVVGWAANGRELENKGPFATPADLAGKQDASANLTAWSALATSAKQDASANLTTLAGIVPGAAGQAILADVTASDVRDYLDLDQIINPKWYGVVGDGVADDTVAFQAAVTAATVLFIPRGMNIKVTNVVTLHGNLTIFGGGKITAGPVAGFVSGAFPSALGMLYSEAVHNITIDGVELDISAWTTLHPSHASMRCIVMRRGTYLRIQNCKFITTGGTVALVGCADFDISGNDATCLLPSDRATVWADGVIDCWVEFNINCARGVIHGNRIRGGGFARWGIMLTGLEFNAVDMLVREMVVSDNIIVQCNLDAIWVFGRDALLDGITITGNVIATARKGISISDARNFVIANNTINNTTTIGIHLWSEFALGVSAGATKGVVSGNNLVDVGTAGGQSGIWIQLGSDSNLISGNNISSGFLSYGILVALDSTDNRIAGNRISGPTVKEIEQFALGNLIDGMDYSVTPVGITNVASTFLRKATLYAYDNRVTVFFNLSVTPSAGGSASTVVHLPLPVASNLLADTLFGGAVVHGAGAASIIEDAASDRASITFAAPGTGEQKVVGSFSYAIN